MSVYANNLTKRSGIRIIFSSLSSSHSTHTPQAVLYVIRNFPTRLSPATRFGTTASGMKVGDGSSLEADYISVSAYTANGLPDDHVRFKE